MALAMAAPPKPLSMFTTATPDAQLFSIPSSAVRPPKLAPYPMLVGTAMTGALTRPPMRPNDTWECALHSSHRHDDPRRLETFPFGEHAMESRDTNVVQRVGLISQCLR